MWGVQRWTQLSSTPAHSQTSARILGWLTRVTTTSHPTLFPSAPQVPSKRLVGLISAEAMSCCVRPFSGTQERLLPTSLWPAQVLVCPSQKCRFPCQLDNPPQPGAGSFQGSAHRKELCFPLKHPRGHQRCWRPAPGRHLPAVHPEWAGRLVHLSLCSSEAAPQGSKLCL